MRKFAIILAAAATTITSAGLAGGIFSSPALADDGCLWAGTPYIAGATVNYGGVGFVCNATTGSGSANWTPGPPKDGAPDVSADIGGLYSVGATLDNSGEAFSWDGSIWSDVGSWNNFATQSGADGGGGGIGGLQP